MSESSREACFGGVKVSKLCMDCVCGCVLASCGTVCMSLGVVESGVMKVHITS